jgi:hypothetical protein
MLHRPRCLLAAVLLVLLPSLLLGGCMSPTFSSLDYSAERSASVEATGAARVEVVAGAGSLRVEGIEGLDEVRARGTARASEEALLQDVQIFTERRGDTVRLEARFPQNVDGRTALDLVVEVPAGRDAKVIDSSGDAEVRAVASLRFDDSSGDLRIQDVAGDVRVNDSSGDVRAEEVAGTLRVNDSSRDIEVRGVRAGVRVANDSSGDIDVRDVQGDFVVASKSSGDIRHEGVGGRVQLPPRWVAGVS